MLIPSYGNRVHEEGSMIYIVCRMTYLVVLVAVLAMLFAHPVPQEEDRWALAVLIGLDVREIAATSGALWGSGRRLLWGWWRRGASKKEGSKRSRPKVGEQEVSSQGEGPTGSQSGSAACWRC